MIENGTWMSEPANEDGWDKDSTDNTELWDREPDAILFENTRTGATYYGKV